MPNSYWLTAQEEKATYDLHVNDAEDQGYRRFLSRLSVPLLEKIGTQKNGLDFGCGPGPVLSMMFQEQGHQVDLYDPFYFNNPLVFDKKYDFICASEVVEHLKDPEQEFARLFSMLKPGGWLGIMTKRVDDQHAFRRWHYIRDLTHICFYSLKTFRHIGQRYNAEFQFLGDDVALYNKK